MDTPNADRGAGGRFVRNRMAEAPPTVRRFTRGGRMLIAWSIIVPAFLALCVLIARF